MIIYNGHTDIKNHQGVLQRSNNYYIILFQKKTIMSKSGKQFSKIEENTILLKTTDKDNFIFVIENVNLNSELFNGINHKESPFEQINKILNQGGKLIFKRIENELFNNNLILVDSYLPLILSYLIIYFYTTGKREIKELTALLTASNPLSYPIDNDFSFYQYKIKSFLFGLITGLTPNEFWNGEYDSKKVLTVIKDNGDILNFNFYEKDNLGDYLYHNTGIDVIMIDNHESIIMGEQENGAYLCKFGLHIRII